MRKTSGHTSKITSQIKRYVLKTKVTNLYSREGTIGLSHGVVTKTQIISAINMNVFLGLNFSWFL